MTAVAPPANISTVSRRRSAGYGTTGTGDPGPHMNETAVTPMNIMTAVPASSAAYAERLRRIGSLRIIPHTHASQNSHHRGTRASCRWLTRHRPPVEAMGMLRHGARVGHRARGLQQRRRRVELHAARPRAQQGLSLG